MIAIVWNQDANTLCRFEDRRPLGHAHRSSFDRQIDHLHVSHQATCDSTEWTRLPWISDSNSERNFLIPETTGTAHESLSTQMVVPVMLSARESNVSRSSIVPWPSRIRSTIFVIHAVPSRHCVHWPQLSWAKNRARRAMTRTIDWSSSITMTPPDPSIDPWATNPS